MVQFTSILKIFLDINLLFYKKNNKKKNKIIENYAIINDYINPKISFLIRRKKKITMCNHNPCVTSLKCSRILAIECNNYHLLNKIDLLDWYLKDYKIFNIPYIHKYISFVLLSKIEYVLRLAYIEKYNIKSDINHLYWHGILIGNFSEYDSKLSFKENIKMLSIKSLLNKSFSKYELNKLYKKNDLDFDILKKKIEIPDYWHYNNNCGYLINIVY